MARQVSKGTCTFCRRELSKSGIANHLQACPPRQTCSYEYDFGSTTELTLKVISEREVAAKEKAIQILARNSLPPAPCDVCGNLPAILACTRCIYEDDGGYLCDECSKEHQCGEEMLNPLSSINSPRSGVCGYTGSISEFTYLAHL